MDSLMQQTLRTSVLWIPHVLILPVSLVCLDVCVSLRPSGFACLILGSVWQGELWYYAEFVEHVATWLYIRGRGGGLRLQRTRPGGLRS